MAEPYTTPFPGLPAGARCANCGHGQLAPNQQGKIDLSKRYCFESPPQQVPIPQYKRGISGPEYVGVQVMMAFPEVDVNMKCHRWCPKNASAPTDADEAAAISGETKAN